MLPAVDVRERLAELAHKQWSGWMDYLFEKCKSNSDGTETIPKWAVDRWKKQMKTNYTELSDTEKDSDRSEADRMLVVINDR